VFTLNPEGDALANGVRMDNQILQVDVIKQDTEAIVATLVDGENKKRPANLEMLRPNGERYKVYLKPKTPTDKPTMRYMDDVAVMTIPTFKVPLNPVSGNVGDFRNFEQRFHTLMLEAQKHGSKRLILDLRSNGGGDPYTGYSLACGLGVKMARVTEDKKGLITTITCDGAGKTLVEYSDEPNPKEPYGFDTANPANWTGPVAVLTTRFTGSAAENLADVLQSTKRGLTVGEATAGALGTDIGSSPLVNQATLYYSVSMMRDLNGHKPGVRIIPDVLVPLEPEGFVQGRDLQLEAAMAKLR
jgi:C-terminal processing protease CtpA/Prc